MILAVYLLFESVLYFSDVRLISVKGIWPASAISYSSLINKVLGSAFLLIAIVAVEVGRNLNKYKTFLKLSGWWAVFHGGVLIFLSLTNNYSALFSMLPSLQVFFPYYNQFLILEGLVSICYGLAVYLWMKND